MYAAALGAAEVFKHTAGVRPARRVIHRHLKFCPVTLSGDLSRAPELPASIPLNLGLIGVGAIGTGIALTLSELPAEGTLLAVDRQQFDRENRGTYCIGNAADAAARPDKVELATSVLRRFDVHEFPFPLSELLTAVDAGTMPWTPLVLTALDTPEARREAQRLWPDRLIDGATGDTMVGLHDHTFGHDPCMRCLFPERHDLPSGAERPAAELGIAAEVLAEGERLLEASDLRGMPEDQRSGSSPSSASRSAAWSAPSGSPPPMRTAHAVGPFHLLAGRLPVGRPAAGGVLGVAPTETSCSTTASSARSTRQSSHEAQPGMLLLGACADDRHRPSTPRGMQRPWRRARQRGGRRLSGPSSCVIWVSIRRSPRRAPTMPTALSSSLVVSCRPPAHGEASSNIQIVGRLEASGR